jgi:hypothetical protein
LLYTGVGSVERITDPRPPGPWNAAGRSCQKTDLVV